MTNGVLRFVYFVSDQRFGGGIRVISHLRDTLTQGLFGKRNPYSKLLNNISSIREAAGNGIRGFWRLEILGSE
jgi:hypothetical protein